MEEMVFGTSGWSYKEWIGPFYENDKRKFTYYSKFFNTAEINSSFYKYPTSQVIFGLTRASPKDFTFSLKLPKLITHDKRLNEDKKVNNDLLRFLEILDPFKSSDKLGCLLVQLPPSFSYERDFKNFQSFIEILPSDYEFCVEFRHESWIKDSIWKLLEKHNVAYCIVDEPLLPPDIHITADFAYFRWHGKGTKLWYDYLYKKEELEEWVPKINEVRKNTKKIYGYFNNHFHGYAIENCIDILEMLNLVNDEQKKIRENIVHFNRTGRRISKEMSLEDYS
ncbi:MAG: DUF72 domain-containing protein [Candidatus Ranarchaeia archaeon]